MSEKRMFCVRLPQRGSSVTGYGEIENKVLDTIASSGKQAITHILARADKKRVGVMATELSDKYKSLDIAADKFTVDAEFIEDYIGVNKVEDIKRVKILPYANDFEMMDELSKRLGGRTSDYRSFMNQYNLHYSHREID